MEVKTAFSIIIGLLMMVMIIIAGVALMSSLTQVTVEDCTPSQQPAGLYGSGYVGKTCGFDVSRTALRCMSASDVCMDSANAMCCPIGESADGKTKIVMMQGQCCKIGTTSPSVAQCNVKSTESDCTAEGCKWCSKCDSTQANQWGADKCVIPTADCGYSCQSGLCKAQCTYPSGNGCSNPLQSHCHPNLCTCQT
jgi:hypothetical protein